MWTLRHPSGQLIHLLPDTTTTIGRKSCDLILEDTSVSHLHAKIVIKTNNDNDYINNEYSSKCIINNAGSKKRTKIISEKTIYLLPFTNYELKHNDKIHFSSKNEWVVSYKKISLLTCGDCIDQIDNLNKIITSIGGTVFTEWNEECNFYSTICKRVTPKFVTALAAGLPFVTFKYWEDFYTCCKTRKEFPNPLKYILKEWHYTDELKDISLQPETARQSLFNNIEFIFFSKYQIDYYGEIIQLAGGRPLMCGKYGFKDKHLLAQNTIIIECDENHRTFNSCCGLSESDYQNICRLLVKEKRKMINEIEIVKAILLCSRERYCNTGFPKLNESKQSKRSITNQPTVTIKPENIIKQKNVHKSQQYTEQSHEKYASEGSTTSESKKNNKTNQEQLSTFAPASTIAKFPEAIVKLQKLTSNVISQFKYSGNKLDVNEKSKRKRKSNSPIISVSRDSSPDIFPFDDDCSVISDSNRKPTSNKQLEIVDDKLISEKIIIKTKNKTKKRKMESKTPSPSCLADNEITKHLATNSEPNFQANFEEVSSQFDDHLSAVSINDKEDNTTVNKNKEEPQISEESLQSIKETKAEQSIPKQTESKLRRDYDSLIKEPHLVNLSTVRKVTPSMKFTSLFDEYIPKSSPVINCTVDKEEDPRIQMIQSFIDEENLKYSTQPNTKSTKSSFFMKSANEKNEVPNFIEMRRKKLG